MDVLIRTAAGMQAKAVTKKTQTKKTSKASFKSAIQDGGEVHEESATQQAAAPQGLDALFLCLDQPSKNPKKQALEQGHTILDILGNIRNGLLQGNLSANTLNDLKAVLQIDVSELQDNSPELQELIQEIQTRAAVELAKLERL